jgi:hypothetical protein
MSRRPDPDQLVLAWLREPARVEGGRVLVRVLEQLDSTPQRGVSWTARRTLLSRRGVRIAIAAAAVLVLAIVGASILPRIGGFGPPEPTPTPSPRPLIVDFLAAGSYTLSPFGPPLDDVTFTFDVPEGWEGYEVGLFQATGWERPDGSGIAFQVIERLYSDPCHAEGRGDVDVGPTLDDLVSAFQAQDAYTTTAPTDIAVDGYPGTQINLLMPEVDLRTCDGLNFIIWEGGPTAQGGNRWQLRIIDVGAIRPVVVVAQDYEGTPAVDREEMHSIVNSIQIDT